MSIGGALHSVMAVDGHGDPLTGVITWADGRAVEQAKSVAGTPAGKNLYRETGCPVHGMYPLYKVIWLRENRPEVFQHARRYVSAKEYVGFRLTGTWQVDYSLAAGSGFLNTYTLEWSDPAIDLAGIRKDQLSPLAAPVALLGKLQPAIAAQMGIPVNTPVVMGSSDAVNSSIGAGAVDPTQATLMVGTSGALRVVSPRPVLDPKARSWCYAIDEKHWLVGGAINNGGVALSWLRDCLNQAHAGQPLTFEDLLALASHAPAGSRGLVCLPFFAGERSPNWNLNARAAFFGMSLEHELRHVARSLLEGVGFRFKSLLEVLLEIGVDVRQIVASGGFTRSESWLQVMADVLGRELNVPAWGRRRRWRPPSGRRWPPAGPIPWRRSGSGFTTATHAGRFLRIKPSTSGSTPCTRNSTRRRPAPLTISPGFKAIWPRPGMRAGRVEENDHVETR